MKKYLAGAFLLAAIVVSIPHFAFAYPFGGMIGQIIFCYNNAIYAAVGPPRGGPFIWTPSTRTYQFGPPARTGQWLLGLAAPPYYCLVSVQPVIVWSGVLMTMQGSSGGAAPGLPGGGLGNSSGGTGGTSGTTNTGIGHLIVSEVYPRADASHGGATIHQWIEIYNPTSASVNISRWTIRATSTSQTIPDNTSLGAGQYLVFAGTTQVRSIWNIASTTQVVAFPGAFSGFVQTGDHIYLQDTAGNRVDSVSYGNDTGAFSPAVPAVATGHALVRRSMTSDSNTLNDWTDTSAPSPGR